MSVSFRGVLPAITTPFTPQLSIDHALLRKHAEWLVDRGCSGLVPVGSLGEASTLSLDEKALILRTCVDAVGNRAPIIPGIAAASTAEAVLFAQLAAEEGCHALMVLPPYVYSSDSREMMSHVGAVIAATPLPCMLYNNPIAYRTDFQPRQIVELAARYPNLVAVKESSGDVRRVTEIVAQLGDRVSVLVGLDDLVLEGVAAGATGWVAGLVNALPDESVELFRLASAGAAKDAVALYRWFLPLLRMDTVPKFVQLIKLVQHQVGRGTLHVRPPRLELEGDERAQALATIAARLAERPYSARAS
jgi:4-hydroxy-tetrahydrodipicolinate synthase